MYIYIYHTYIYICLHHICFLGTIVLVVWPSDNANILASGSKNHIIVLFSDKLENE